MAFLIKHDLRTILRETGADNLTDSDDTIVDEAILSAVDYVRSKIEERFDPDQIFIDLYNYSDSDTYDYFSNYTEYDSDTTYTTGQKVQFYGFVYEAAAGSKGEYPVHVVTKEDNNDKEFIRLEVNTDYWTKLTFKTAIYYTEAAYVAATAYVIDDRISYDDGTNTYIYVCIQNSTGNLPTDTAYWSIVTYNSINIRNYDYFYAKQETTGNKPDDTTYWTKGDLRNSLIKRYTALRAGADLFIQNPRVASGIVIEMHDKAIEHLNRISDGRDSLAVLPTYPDISIGEKYTYGGSDIQDFDY